ncbi:MAG: CHAP domain-containing protein, partial [Flavobacteriales bacterium]|nr:CHAP domain-containing protein [Flavobacteriales bacterium]
MKKFALFLLLLTAVVFTVWRLLGDRVRDVLPTKHVPGAPLDSLHGVVVYDNGGFGAKHGRNVVDGYNIGLKYQC